MKDDLTLYREMLAAKKAGDTRLADQLMAEKELKRETEFEKPNDDIVNSISLILPSFAKSVLGKPQQEVDPKTPANCINAALNFFSDQPRMKPYSPDEFLIILQDQYQQIFEENHCFGDLVVVWTRTYGSWDNRMINVHEMRDSDSDYPYGLIFDHVMVEVTPLLVFHKPDPTLQSRYMIEFYDSVIAPSTNLFGFETTRHRRLDFDSGP